MVLSFFKSLPLDEELKGVREKNREYESAQERLSSEQVRQTITTTIIISFVILLFGYTLCYSVRLRFTEFVIIHTNYITCCDGSVNLWVIFNFRVAFLCNPDVKTCLHFFAVFF